MRKVLYITFIVLFYIDNIFFTNGIYYATVAQNPFEIGVQAIEAAVHAVEGQDDGIVKVDGILVTRDTVQEYMANREKSLEELKDYLAIITAS